MANGENGNGEIAKRAISAYLTDKIVVVLSVFLVPVVTTVIIWAKNIDDRLDEINLRMSIHENEDKAIHAKLEKLEKDLEAYIKPFPSQSIAPRGVLQRE